MKILIYSDIHISEQSSIVKSFSDKFTTRLEHIIDSINWAEKLANEQQCDAIFNLGDTFDKSSISSMEATSLKSIKWNEELNHYILVGNHDSNVASLKYNVVEVLGLNSFKTKVIIKPEIKIIDNIAFCFLPYIIETDRKSLRKIFDFDSIKDKKIIIISHNDIAGFNFGGFISKDGFDIKEIENNCDLFLNGHLHNSSYLSKKILNVGNLCGMNFSEDAFKYKHGCWILDTDDLSLTFYENPYSFNFYKINIDSKHSLLDYNLKSNSVLMIKCDKEYLNKLKEDLSNSKTIIAYKILVEDNNIVSKEEQVELHKVDHLRLFHDYMVEQLGNTQIVNEELKKICEVE